MACEVQAIFGVVFKRCRLFERHKRILVFYCFSAHFARSLSVIPLTAPLLVHPVIVRKRHAVLGKAASDFPEQIVETAKRPCASK